MNKDLEKQIYAPVLPEYDKLFKRVEAALGFKLFIWQKTFIISGHLRRYGRTTAEILRELLNIGAEPIDYTNCPRSMQEELYRYELRKVYEKLKNAGIETRTVLWSKDDKIRYLN